MRQGESLAASVRAVIGVMLKVGGMGMRVGEREGCECVQGRFRGEV